MAPELAPQHAAWQPMPTAKIQFVWGSTAVTCPQVRVGLFFAVMFTVNFTPRIPPGPVNSV